MSAAAQSNQRNTTLTLYEQFVAEEFVPGDQASSSGGDVDEGVMQPRSFEENDCRIASDIAP